MVDKRVTGLEVNRKTKIVGKLRKSTLSEK